MQSTVTVPLGHKEGGRDGERCDGGVMEREAMIAVTRILASAVDRLEYLMRFLVA